MLMKKEKISSSLRRRPWRRYVLCANSINVEVIIYGLNCTAVIDNSRVMEDKRRVWRVEESWPRSTGSSSTADKAATPPWLDIAIDYKPCAVCRHAGNSSFRYADRLKPCPHQQQCRSNIVECCNLQLTSPTIISTLLLVWTGLNNTIRYGLDEGGGCWI